MRLSDSGDSLRKHLVDVREMHLETVLVFVDVLGHPVELAGLVEFCCCGCVDGEVSQRRAVVGAFCQCGFLEVQVV